VSGRAVDAFGAHGGFAVATAAGAVMAVLAAAGARALRPTGTDPGAGAGRHQYADSAQGGHAPDRLDSAVSER
ncbi:MAG: hypothetical protein ACRDP8_03370, partial [Actinopolymorphaceae bacterium]